MITILINEICLVSIENITEKKCGLRLILSFFKCNGSSPFFQKLSQCPGHHWVDGLKVRQNKTIKPHSKLKIGQDLKRLEPFLNPEKKNRVESTRDFEIENVPVHSVELLPKSADVASGPCVP